jgi:predicted nicotinamide N-methyase
VSDVVHPAIIGGRRVRCHTVELGRGVVVRVLEAADADAVLDEAVIPDGDAYAAVLWPGAVAAATRVVHLATPGMRVLDLGAGTGVAALAAALLGARVTAADHDEFARAVIREAAALNGVDIEVADFDVASDTALPAADLVVIADLLYQPDLARAAALRTLEAHRAGARVLATDPGRYGRTVFQRTLQDAGVPTVFDDVVVRVPGEPAGARVGVALIEPRTPPL